MAQLMWKAVMAGAAVVLAQPIDINSWTYDRCAPTGPNFWPGICPSQAQGSPINLCGAQALGAQVLFSRIRYEQPIQMQAVNTGRTVQLLVVDPEPPTLQVGDLPAVVGRGPDTVFTFQLAQVHAHWGRLGQGLEGSEHYIEGRKLSMEIHLVHFNTQFSNYTAAVASGRPEAVLVVAVLFLAKLGDEAPFLTAYGDAAANATAVPQDVPTGMVVNDVFDAQGDFYAYAGSLTIPPCAELVTWVVMKTVHQINVPTLDKLRRVPLDPSATPTGAAGSTGGSSPDQEQVVLENGAQYVPPMVANESYISWFGNFRPLQDQGTRTVYQSGGPTGPCRAIPRLPEFDCSSGAARGPTGGLGLAGLLACLALPFLLGG